MTALWTGFSRWLRYGKCRYCGHRGPDVFESRDGKVACEPCATRILASLGYNRAAKRSRGKR